MNIRFHSAQPFQYEYKFRRISVPLTLGTPKRIILPQVETHRSYFERHRGNPVTLRTFVNKKLRIGYLSSTKVQYLNYIIYSILIT